MLALAFVLLLVAHIVPSNAIHFPRASGNIGKAANHVHRVVLRRSAGFAQDLRVAINGVLVSQPSEGGVTQSRVYCIGTNPGSGPSGGHHNGTSTPVPSATSSTSAAGSTVSPSPWKLVEQHQGSDFFSGWDFFVGDDPTSGNVQFVDQGTSQSNNLSSVNSRGNAVMSIETTAQVQNSRRAVRITTQSSYNGGLFIMDSVHMPTGCGTWPAFWTNGPNWPTTGEIDIVEGINSYTHNQATIHSGPGCSMPSASSAALAMTGTAVSGTDCSSVNTGNQGCGVRASQNNSFGAAFNSNGGGVYAMKWDSSGISVFFFPRGSVPSDIDANAPQPSQWGTPLANWPASSCDPFQYFRSHSVIFDTTLCGDWAGSAWTSSGVPGQEQSCAQMTGSPTCQAFVLANGGAFAEAYWEVVSVKIYQSK